MIDKFNIKNIWKKKKRETPCAEDNNIFKNIKLFDKTIYKRIIRSLICLSRYTGQEISFDVNKASRRNELPTIPILL